MNGRADTDPAHHARMELVSCPCGPDTMPVWTCNRYSYRSVPAEQPEACSSANPHSPCPTPACREAAGRRMEETEQQIKNKEGWISSWEETPLCSESEAQRTDESDRNRQRSGSTSSTGRYHYQPRTLHTAMLRCMPHCFLTTGGGIRQIRWPPRAPNRRSLRERARGACWACQLCRKCKGNPLKEASRSVSPSLECAATASAIVGMLHCAQYCV